MKKYKSLLLISFIIQLPLLAQQPAKKRPVVDLTQDSDAELILDSDLDSDSEEKVEAPVAAPAPAKRPRGNLMPWPRREKASISAQESLKRAINFYEKGNLKQAENWFFKVINEIEASAQELVTAYYYLGFIYSRLPVSNNIRMAISYFKKALETNGLESQYKAIVYSQLGFLNNKIGNHDTAIAHYNDALQQQNVSYKERANILHNLGLIYVYSKNDRVNAKRFFEQSLAMSSYNQELSQVAASSKFELAKLITSIQPDIAQQYFNEALPQFTNQPNIVADIYIHLGHIALDKKNIDNAITYLNNALKISMIEPSDKSKALALMGLAYERKKDFATAKKFYQQASEVRNLPSEEKKRIAKGIESKLKELDKQENFDALIDAAIYRSNQQ